MRLDFFDRTKELGRLTRALDHQDGSLVCLYGRRRLGKSRLIRHLLRGRASAVYHVCDERDAAIQRSALSEEMGRVLPDFEAVTYPSWDSLLRRWWDDAPARSVLALDEFPYLVASAPEIPSLMQKLVDSHHLKSRHVILCGSSQRMMLGLLLDASAPLFGRSREIIRLAPLGIDHLPSALGLRRPSQVIAHYCIWGGVPRYWELAAEYSDMWEAVEDLLLDPMGVLHREPASLLLDAHREIARAASLLSLVGQGCHRVSEIAGRIGVPATSLSRPLSRLMELGYLTREVPFAAPARSSKRTFYRIQDPFLRFWFRFVEPNRSLLEAGQVRTVLRQIRRDWPQFLGQGWEDLARASVPDLDIDDRQWLPAARWWGKGRDGRNLELDIVAAAEGEPDQVLVGEAKSSLRGRDVRELMNSLRRKAERCPALADKQITTALWVLDLQGRSKTGPVITARQVLRAGQGS